MMGNDTRSAALPHHRIKDLDTNLSADHKLLLNCARTHLSLSNIRDIKVLLNQITDWPTLIQLARRHGVLPLLYQNLKLTSAKDIDDQVLEQLQSFSQKTALQNTIFTRDLLNILTLLNRNDIQALPFKGPTLAVSAYKNLSLRSFCDLDILIPNKDCLKAIDVLVTQGHYQPIREWHFLNKKWEDTYLKSYREFSLTNGIVSIDLHQYLTVEGYLSSEFSFEYLWNNHETIDIASQSIPNFGQIDLLLYLCVHASKECWRKLKWICDISEFVQVNPDLDWHRLFDRAQTLHCERRVLTGLLLAHYLLELPLPEIVSHRAEKDQICYALTAEFIQRLFWQDNQLGRQFTIEKFYLHLKSLENIEDKLKSWEELNRQLKTIFIKLLPNSKDYGYLPLPKSLNFIYYFIRPYRMLQEKISYDRNKK